MYPCRTERRSPIAAAGRYRHDASRNTEVEPPGAFTRGQRKLAPSQAGQDHEVAEPCPSQIERSLPAPPAPARPPCRRPLPEADQAPAHPRRPPQRIRASRVGAQVMTGGRLLEPHRHATGRTTIRNPEAVQVLA